MWESQNVIQYQVVKPKFYKRRRNVSRVEKELFKNMFDKMGKKIGSMDDIIFKEPELINLFVKPILGKLAREEFHILYLDVNLRLLCYEVVGIGGISEVDLNISNIATTMLVTGAEGIVALHNHPSGNLEPSRLDIEATKSLLNMCVMFKRRMHDHIIVTYDDYFSIRASDKVKHSSWGR